MQCPESLYQKVIDQEQAAQEFLDLRVGGAGPGGGADRPPNDPSVVDWAGAGPAVVVAGAGAATEAYHEARPGLFYECLGCKKRFQTPQALRGHTSKTGCFKG